MLRFTRVEFHRFKAFSSFSISLRHFNIIVGPNNAGKSTILAAFRILAAGLRRANSRKPTFVRYKGGEIRAYDVDLSAISVAEENLFYNYNEDSAASIKFTLSNKNTLTLYFPEREVCYLIPEHNGRQIETPSAFRSHFDCSIGFVPILGPVEHNEPLYEKEAARLALFSYRAARNFRNIWHHYPDRFETFRSLLQETWPGMDIEPPEVDRSHQKPRLHMYCPEQRIPRELFWSGFGFQVWCQMLTHIIQNRDASLFLIDEPDIYLHSELQRQLLMILRSMGPDILIATHSTEIVSEADFNEIVLVSKKQTSARRLKDPSQLADVLRALGSSANPVLTQLAKTRRAVFVEGNDYHIIGRFAHRLSEVGVGNRRDFAVVPVEGFNPERIKNLIAGIQSTLGLPIKSAIILDGDYRCDDEKVLIQNSCEAFSSYTVIHDCNEIENFILVPEAIDRALQRRLADKERRTGQAADYVAFASACLDRFAEECKIEVQSRMIADRKQYMKTVNPRLSDATINAQALRDLEAKWSTQASRLALLPGKEALAEISKAAQERFSVSLTASSIIEAMTIDEIPLDVKKLVGVLKSLSQESVTDEAEKSAA